MMRMNRNTEVVPDVLPSGLRDIPQGDESETTEQVMHLGHVDIDEIDPEEIVTEFGRIGLPLSIARDAMDPADILPRNMRIVPRRSGH